MLANLFNVIFLQPKAKRVTFRKRISRYTRYRCSASSNFEKTLPSHLSTFAAKYLKCGKEGEFRQDRREII